MERLYNFSGHPVAGFDVAPFIGVNFPNDAESLVDLMRATCKTLPGRDALLAGEKGEVVLPGLAHAAAVLLAEWHGQFGQFPRIRWAVRGESGFAWPEEARCNLNAVRHEAREER